MSIYKQRQINVHLKEQLEKLSYSIYGHKIILPDIIMNTEYEFIQLSEQNEQLRHQLSYFKKKLQIDKPLLKFELLPDDKLYMDYNNKARFYLINKSRLPASAAPCINCQQLCCSCEYIRIYI